MIRVVDVETTGIDPNQHHVIEIASLDLTKAGVESPRRTFVALPSGLTIPPESSAIHHIIDDDLASQPPLREALKMFEGADIHVAHMARFEASFLPLAPWVCTYKCALRIWPDAPGHSNQTLRYWLGLIEPFSLQREQIVAHRALWDCYITAAIFHEMLKVEGVTFSDMKRWSAEPPLWPRMTFGKHKGEKLEDVPHDYLKWMAEKATEIEPDWVTRAQRELMRRAEAKRAAPATASQA